MIKENKKVRGGLYLVLDPSIPLHQLLYKLEQALEGGVNMIQIWNNWPIETNKTNIIEKVCNITAPYNIPTLINNDWDLLKSTPLDGVHFDEIPECYENIKATVDSDFICGITCTNNLTNVHWAIENKLDYISFCSMFPSGSAAICDLVEIKTVQKARQLTSMPIFLAGGITPDNMPLLKETEAQGVAVISGILNAPNTKEATLNIKNAIHHLNNK